MPSHRCFVRGVFSSLSLKEGTLIPTVFLKETNHRHSCLCETCPYASADVARAPSSG